MFQLVVNVLGTVVSGLCALLLLRAWSKVRSRLLLWAGLCFTGLFIANGLVVADLFYVRDMDLYRWRLGIAAGAMVLLVYGLIFESERS